MSCNTKQRLMLDAQDRDFDLTQGSFHLPVNVSPEIIIGAMPSHPPVQDEDKHLFDFNLIFVRNPALHKASEHSIKG
ncbi:hypothetical protein P5673_016207 [Acropora cervicornis]|uniref:Uncharacterized protein n=1 Tax=Acropora cervicornis TaxID=6130 RepID=A0AAD9QH12_ACRCE|nr:hypothetical protein P5673_016207 [Acropora cervicornis]